MKSVDIGFACACGPDNERELRELHEKIRPKLERNWILEDSDMTEIYIHSLCNDFKRFASISGIAVDQWFGVSAEVYAPDEDKRRLRVQCDRIVDGLAYIWEYMEDTYGLYEEDKA